MLILHCMLVCKCNHLHNALRMKKLFLQIVPHAAIGSQNSSTSQPLPSLKTKVLLNHMSSSLGHNVVSTWFGRTVLIAYKCGLMRFQPGTKHLRTMPSWTTLTAGWNDTLGSNSDKTTIWPRARRLLFLKSTSPVQVLKSVYYLLLVHKLLIYITHINTLIHVYASYANPKLKTSTTDTKQQTCKIRNWTWHLNSENENCSWTPKVVNGLGLFSVWSCCTRRQGFENGWCHKRVSHRKAQFGKVFASQAFQLFSQTQMTTLAAFSGNAFQLVGFLPPRGNREEKLGGLGGAISTEVRDFVWTHPPIPWTRESREHKDFDLQDFLIWQNCIDVSMFENPQWRSCLWHEI